ncbi:uncharacterized protein JCM15063_000654 [Sporobolomyces koalae]|uniref:uncharacterized protein n=1 Tax=Sporobolomyces koalae TaxID=500713 RepID=UPI0031751C87
MSATTNGSGTSPEVEFGTFLRLPHQSRTFARPADAYIPSSPPSRPISPPPTLAPSPAVYLHGRPAPVVSKMRQGAPRLGGLGLGGIVEPSSHTPPPLPARKLPPSNAMASTPAVGPRAIPPVPAASKPASGTEIRAPNLPPSTTANFDPSAGLPQRPFLSPEMDKPTAREGAFALDRPKFEDVLKRTSDDEEESQEQTQLDRSLSTGNDREATAAPQSPSREGFPSPPVAEQDNDDLFDHFKSALVLNQAPEPSSTAEQSGKGLLAEDEPSDNDMVSDESTGDSSFATPETVPVSDAEEEHIPRLALSENADKSSQRPASFQEKAEEAKAGAQDEDEEEEIAFDGPVELAENDQIDDHDRARTADTLDREVEEDSTPHIQHTSTFGDLERSFPPLFSTLAESLALRADKTFAAERSTESPTVSAATSVYNSREPSVYALHLDDDEGEHEKHSAAPADPPSPTRSRESSLHEQSPSYSQGARSLDEAAAQYPSPPSSPATSVHSSLTREVTQPPNPPPEDFPIYSYSSNAPEKHPRDEPEFIEHSTDSLGVDHVTSSEPPKEPASSESEAMDRHEDRPVPPPANTASHAPQLTSSPFSDFSTRAPRQSRFSYSGLGLRMPSSISPRAPLAHEADQTIPAAPSARREQTEAAPQVDLTDNARATERDTVPAATTVLFPWLSSPKHVEAPADVEAGDEPGPLASRELPFALSNHADDGSSPSSPSAYAPSSTMPSPEISREPLNRVDALEPPPPASNPPDSPVPEFSTLPAHVANPETETVSPLEVAQLPPGQSTSKDTEIVEAPSSATAPEVAQDDTEQASAVGVAVDIGTAVAGVLVMGGLAVGQSALRGLAVGWSAWRGASNQPVLPETRVVEVSSVPEEAEKDFKDYARPVQASSPAEESAKAESSVISTDWGEAEFDAPEGFLEEFKRAMAEIGEEDLAANEQAQIDAQLAAYESATRQHVDAVSSPTLSDNSSLSSSSTPSISRIARSRESSALRSQPETIDEDSADEEERELEDLMSSVWESPGRRSRIAADLPTRHGFAPPPGLTGSFSGVNPRPTSISSLGSVQSNTPPSTPASPRQPAKLSKTSRSILGFGRSKSTTKLAKSSTPLPPSPSLPGLSQSQSSRTSTKAAQVAPDQLRAAASRSIKAQSVRSSESISKAEDKQSQLSNSSSHKTAGRRSSIFNFGNGNKEAPPIPSIESQIKDTTYISYSSAKLERRTSNASSISTGLYASRDPYLITPSGPTSIPASPASRTGKIDSVSSSNSQNALSRTEDLGGAPLGRRKSSLRSGSAYDRQSQRSATNSSIVDRDTKLYRVRFGNAVGGIGLRSVADSEAERAGGDRYGQRWVGIGRGRYGNMVIKTDEESDMVYAEQVAQIKKKWRAFGSEQSRDWAAVRIDK